MTFVGRASLDSYYCHSYQCICALHTILLLRIISHYLHNPLQLSKDLQPFREIVRYNQISTHYPHLRDSREMSTPAMNLRSSSQTGAGSQPRSRPPVERDGPSVAAALERLQSSSTASGANASRQREDGEQGNHSNIPSSASAGSTQAERSGDAGVRATRGEGEETDIGNDESDAEYEELKRQAERKQRAAEKQALRNYVLGSDPSLSFTIDGKQFGNPETLKKS